jgi:hypothetical protein
MRVRFTAACSLLMLGALAGSGPAVTPARGAETVPLEQSSGPATCDTPRHHELDFWVGDWKVYDGDDLVAIDRVQKHTEGCIIQQNLSFITDMYRRPGVKYRLSGISINRLDGERWVQMWADNQWGTILMYGSVAADGSLVFSSVVPSRNRDIRDVWERRPDGSLRNLHYTAPAGSGRWQKYGDLVYRPNR